MRTAVEEHLTHRFGAPSGSSTAPEYGTDSWWNLEGQGRILLRLTAIDSDECLLTLSTRRFMGESAPHPEHQKFSAPTWSTSEHSEAGAFDTKWGMGPADVASAYPDLSGSFDIPPVRSYSSKLQLDGDVAIHFDFLQGELAQLTLFYHGFSFGPSFASTTPLSDEDLEILWFAARRWRNDVINTITEKYGPPEAGPSPEETAAIDEDEAGDRSQLRWQWSTDNSVIQLSHTSQQPLLRYNSRAHLLRLALAYEALERTAQEARAKKF